MPYSSNEELPERVKNVLPEHAQNIFRESLNHALDEYKDPGKRRGDENLEQVANKVAWSAVEKKYAKGEDGRWEPRI